MVAIKYLWHMSLCVEQQSDDDEMSWVKMLWKIICSISGIVSCGVRNRGKWLKAGPYPLSGAGIWLNDTQPDEVMLSYDTRRVFTVQ